MALVWPVLYAAVCFGLSEHVTGFIESIEPPALTVSSKLDGLSGSSKVVLMLPCSSVSSIWMSLTHCDPVKRRLTVLCAVPCDSFTGAHLAASRRRHAESSLQIHLRFI